MVLPAEIHRLSCRKSQSIHPLKNGLIPAKCVDLLEFLFLETGSLLILEMLSVHVTFSPRRR